MIVPQSGEKVTYVRVIVPQKGERLPTRLPSSAIQTEQGFQFPRNYQSGKKRLLLEPSCSTAQAFRASCVSSRISGVVRKNFVEFLALNKASSLPEVFEFLGRA